MKRVIIDPEYLFGLLRGDLSVVGPIPPAARLMTANYDPGLNVFTLYIADASFEEIPEGEVIPQFAVILRKADRYLTEWNDGE